MGNQIVSRSRTQTDHSTQRQATLPPDKSEDILQQAHYFQNNLKRMNYLEMRMEGYPIGSGMVESAVKQYKGRFCGAGMRWSRQGGGAPHPSPFCDP